ncbi:MAG: alpha/beta hydrolase [Pseudomonadota bacterium]
MQTYQITTADGLTLHARSVGSSTTAPPVVCLHGLTRNATDFDDLANVLAPSRIVFALDFRGRGRSDYDDDWTHYVPPVYVGDVIAMLDQLEISRAIFCGTSLGGLVTMLLARDAPERLVGAILNDIGPVIEPAGLERIQTYTGAMPSVATWDEALAQVKSVYAASVPGLSDAQWQQMVSRSFCANDAGQPVLAFDQNIGRAIRELDMQLGDPWSLFAALDAIPTLVLRGAMSDILSEATVDAMQARHPNLQRATIAQRGHAPLLNEPDSVAAIQNFIGALT